ncbi:MAG: pseudouridine synthase, partial [Terracidiphilus sp.]
MTDENRPEANEDELIEATESKSEDPIGDETDGEAATTTGHEPEAEIEAAEEDALAEAEVDPEIEADADDAEGEDENGEEDGGDEPESKPKSRPPAKLERLQKILAQAGIASRRKAEEMIEQGRVQVNGTVVTELGTKADAGRDHIRVDGKLLQGAERLRYFVLNKPRGFVTTVKDPEGRPTVMQFFDKMRERLYPVGRLDYMSEGLLVVTNDGELANKLTKASAGVEKTYLVKVAGVPTEAELDTLRAGVAIEKGKPGSGKVRTSPARIRQVRQGDNPWYEVVLIEGRNRELRKMFEEVGHFVEKIRRVGYGPLVLDQEPGNLRELDPQELELLRKAADGKLKTPDGGTLSTRCHRRSRRSDRAETGRPRDQRTTSPRGRSARIGRLDPYLARQGLGPVRRSSDLNGLLKAVRLVRHGKRTRDLRGLRRDSMLDHQVKGVRRRARLMAIGLQLGAASAEGRRVEPLERSLAALDPMETSLPDDRFRRNRHGRSRSPVIGHLISGHRRHDRMRRGGQRQSQWKTSGQGSRRGCTLSRFRILVVPSGQGRTGRARTVHRRAIRDLHALDLGVQGRFGQVAGDRVLRDRSVAKAGWRGRLRLAAGSLGRAG